jgi:ABC-type sugar transport system ATPase subunit
VSALAVEGLSKRFEEVEALRGVSFALADGEFFCIVGPSNAGKSTLLQTIAGLHQPDAGRIRIDRADVTLLEPRRRDVSLLFQNVALFPNLTGFDNIAFPLRAAGTPDAEIDRRVREVAALLGVGHLLERQPRTFSGGEQQRVAIGRAIARRARLLMLDEPLTNLDARLRIALRIEFKALHRDSGQTILYVTHDQVEAMSLSDRIAVLNDGRFEQIGTPDEIYHRPATRFVATFVGTPPMNILEVGIEERAGQRLAKAARLEVPLPEDAKLPRRSRRLGLGVRPEAVAVAPVRSAATPFPGEVFWIERLGDRSILDARIDGQVVKAVVPAAHPVERPGAAWFGFAAGADHLLDLETGAFIR